MHSALPVGTAAVAPWPTIMNRSPPGGARVALHVHVTGTGPVPVPEYVSRRGPWGGCFTRLRGRERAVRSLATELARGSCAAAGAPSSYTPQLDGPPRDDVMVLSGTDYSPYDTLDRL